MLALFIWLLGIILIVAAFIILTVIIVRKANNAGHKNDAEEKK